MNHDPIIANTALRFTKVKRILDKRNIDMWFLFSNTTVNNAFSLYINNELKQVEKSQDVEEQWSRFKQPVLEFK